MSQAQYNLSTIYLLIKIENAEDSLNLLLPKLNSYYEQVQSNQINRNNIPNIHIYSMNKHELISQIKTFLTENKEIFKDNAIDKIHKYPKFISKWTPSIITLGLFCKFILFPVINYIR